MRLFSLFSRNRPDEELRPAIRRPKKVVRFLAAGVILAVLVFLAAPPFQVAQVPFQPGQQMAKTVIAQFPFSVESREKTRQRISDAVRKVGKVYAYDGEAAKAIVRDLDALVDLTEKFEYENSAKPPRERAPYSQLAEQFLQKTRIAVTSSTLAVLSGRIRDARFRESMGTLFDRLYRDWVIVEPTYRYDWDTGDVRVKVVSGQAPTTPSLAQAQTIEQLRSRLEKDYLPSLYPAARPGERNPTLDAFLELTLALARPNLTAQPDETAALINRVRESVRPVVQNFRRADVIVRRGEIPTSFQADVLNHYTLRIRYYRVLRLTSYLVLVVGMLAFLAIYARRFRPLVRFRTATIVTVGVPLLVTLSVGRAAITLLADRFTLEQVGYLFPVPLLGMLGVILLDTEMAIILVLMGSILVGMATGMSFPHALPAVFGGLTAVSCLHRLRQRSQLFQAALLVAAVNVVTIGLLRFIEDPTRLYYGAVAWGSINAALSYFLAIGMFPLFESIFGITSDVRLLELTGVHHPLIGELEERSPGTYQHSLNVAKLAEAAADAIGANYLLVRAGALFHDVGKTLKPRYFSENQITFEERHAHEKLSPYMSCLIIRNHVKEGIDLARRSGLPERVVDFIPQHHGTCLIRYFYHEAIRQYEESESAEPVRESDFRYPGPKPQSIEAAIVMLADAVEATATSKLIERHIDEDDIRRVVIDSVQDKFSDGQFDECHLTLLQLHEIRESMVRTLVGRYHHRIEYPATPTPVPFKKPVREPTAV